MSFFFLQLLQIFPYAGHDPFFWEYEQNLHLFII